MCQLLLHELTKTVCTCCLVLLEESCHCWAHYCAKLRRSWKSNKETCPAMPTLPADTLMNQLRLSEPSLSEVLGCIHSLIDARVSSNVSKV